MSSMKFIAPTLLVLAAMASNASEITCGPTWVQKIEDACKNLSSQVQAANCLELAQRKADRELNAEYTRLITELEDPSKLRQAERDWTKFRESEVEYALSGYSCGTPADMSMTMCRDVKYATTLPLTCERLRQIKSHLKSSCNGCPPRKTPEN
jgi:uncharacterized protein YecT (DUF1311 family)